MVSASPPQPDGGSERLEGPTAAANDVGLPGAGDDFQAQIDQAIRNAYHHGLQVGHVGSLLWPAIRPRPARNQASERARQLGIPFKDRPSSLLLNRPANAEALTLQDILDLGPAPLPTANTTRPNSSNATPSSKALSSDRNKPSVGQQVDTASSTTVLVDLRRILLEEIVSLSAGKSMPDRAMALAKLAEVTVGTYQAEGILKAAA